MQGAYPGCAFINIPDSTVDVPVNFPIFLEIARPTKAVFHFYDSSLKIFRNPAAILLQTDTGLIITLPKDITEQQFSEFLVSFVGGQIFLREHDDFFDHVGSICFAFFRYFWPMGKSPDRAKKEITSLIDIPSENILAGYKYPVISTTENCYKISDGRQIPGVYTK